MESQDKQTTIANLKEILLKFRNARQWEQFHTPKNLANAISIESSELMEHFLWKTDDEIEQSLKEVKFREEVEDELADIVNFCLNFANRTHIDIASVVKRKMAKNEERYPVEKSKGNARKHTEL